MKLIKIMRGIRSRGVEEYVRDFNTNEDVIEINSMQTQVYEMYDEDYYILTIVYTVRTYEYENEIQYKDCDGVLHSFIKGKGLENE